MTIKSILQVDKALQESPDRSCISYRLVSTRCYAALLRSRPLSAFRTRVVRPRCHAASVCCTGAQTHCEHTTGLSWCVVVGLVSRFPADC